jgi:hypothetical protein
MTKFKITIHVPNGSNRTEEVCAAKFAFVGHESEWVEFSDGSGSLLLLRAKSVARIERAAES